jgi:hypothetical protein
MRALARSAASISRWVSGVLTGSAGATGRMLTARIIALRLGGSSVIHAHRIAMSRTAARLSMSILQASL